MAQQKGMKRARKVLARKQKLAVRSKESNIRRVERLEEEIDKAAAASSAAPASKKK